jgi:hypothetical protein
MHGSRNGSRSCGLAETAEESNAGRLAQLRIIDHELRILHS